MYEMETELELESELEGESEFELEFELEGESELEHELEFEGEGEGEFELEFESEISPVRKIYADAMMEHFAHMAAEAESEQEAAEHFLPLIGMAASKLLPMAAKALAPAAKRLLPQMARAVTRVTPQLTRGIGTIARKLYRDPGTRRLLHAVPTIARRTIGNIAGQVARGRPITAKTAVRALARQTARTLRDRPRRGQILRRSRMMDHRFHRHLGPRNVRPHVHGGVRPGHATGHPQGQQPGYPQGHQQGYPQGYPQGHAHGGGYLPAPGSPSPAPYPTTYAPCCRVCGS